MRLWVEPLAYWGVFLFVSGVLLLNDNSVFSKHTVFFNCKRFPWIWMEEYFPGSTKRKDTMLLAGQKIIPVKPAAGHVNIMVQNRQDFYLPYKMIILLPVPTNCPPYGNSFTQDFKSAVLAAHATK
jgi:hypothetical protein